MNAVRELAEELLNTSLAADPLEATLLGVPGYDDRLADLSEDAERDFVARLTDIADRADRIDPSTVAADDQVTRAVIGQQARARIDWLNARPVEYTVTNLFVAPAAELLALLPSITLPDQDRATAFLARLRSIPDFLASAAQRHLAGAAEGRVPVRHLVQASIAHLDRYLADPANDPLLRPRPDEPSETFDRERERVLDEVVRPAFATYRDTLAAELVQPGRPEERSGLCWLPDGEKIYALLSKVHTTTERTPEELHQTGLDLIDQLRTEYAEVGERLFGTGDQQEIFGRMTSDPQMRWSSAQELLGAAREIVLRAEAEAPNWFGRLPSQPCRVEPVPAADAPGAPAAYYLVPTLDGVRPGTYYANTDRAQERDRFVAEAMAFHEAVPGHHLQLALAQELTELPMLRRMARVNAYSEGWGLYSERLAEEMGLYSGDLARLGMLAMDSMRAGRLVVDTGIHAKRWSREQAVTYLRQNTPMSALEIGNEVDRYIAYPGQALSYMVGRLELLRMRSAARRRLGDRFDIKAFHDLVIGGGPLPLNVLEEVITAWSGDPHGGEDLLHD